MTKDKEIGKITVDLGIVIAQIAEVKADVQIINNKLDSNFATKEWVDLNYGQTKKLVNGMVATILFAVLGALIALVVQR